MSFGPVWLLHYVAATLIRLFGAPSPGGRRDKAYLSPGGLGRRSVDSAGPDPLLTETVSLWTLKKGALKETAALRDLPPL